MNLALFFPPLPIFSLAIFFWQSTKFWLMCQEDLNTMNKCIKNVKGSIMLWCDARSTSSAILLLWEQAEKGIRNPAFIKAAANRRLFWKICNRNMDTTPQLRCWARMISTGKYDTIPAFLELDKHYPRNLSALHSLMQLQAPQWHLQMLLWRLP